MGGDGIAIAGSHDRSISLSLPRPDLEWANRSGMRACVEILMEMLVRKAGSTSSSSARYTNNNDHVINCNVHVTLLCYAIRCVLRLSALQRCLHNA